MSAVNVERVLARAASAGPIRMRAPLGRSSDITCIRPAVHFHCMDANMQNQLIRSMGDRTCYVMMYLWPSRSDCRSFTNSQLPCPSGRGTPPESRAHVVFLISQSDFWVAIQLTKNPTVKPAQNPTESILKWIPLQTTRKGSFYSAFWP